MQLNTYIYGDEQKPALIMIHGLFGSGKLWRQYATQFADEYWVHTPDLRNHGQSPHTASMSYVEMAQDIVEYMDQHNIHTAKILGHSMGGKVAMQLAMDYPDHVEKLLVEDIAPMYYKPRHASVFAAIEVLGQHTITSRAQADELIKDILDDKSLRLFLYTNLKKQEDGSLNWFINMDAIIENYDAISRAPECHRCSYLPSTLFLKGSNSNYILDEYRRKIREWFPLSRIHTFKGAGHWLHAEQPKMFIHICKTFLSEQSYSDLFDQV